ncbi:MAG TPA: glycosyltransferase family 2 protein, partial [Verrucomicrobiae bacterium]|nr:glycosyltransferase family 2 protein [Verrucomicrobiae bacterium]
YFRKNFGRSTCAVLAIGLLLRLWVDWTAAALVAVLTLGQSARWRSRFAVCSALLGWHLRLCPADAGLPRA